MYEVDFFFGPTNSNTQNKHTTVVRVRDGTTKNFHAAPKQIYHIYIV